MKSKIIFSIIFMALLVPLSSITYVVAEKPRQITFGGYASGQGIMMWGASMLYSHMWGSPEYWGEMNGNFYFGGTGLSRESDFVHLDTQDGHIESWELMGVRSSTLMIAEWEENIEGGETIQHNLIVRFQITGKSDFVYSKNLGLITKDGQNWIGPYEMEVLDIGINLDYYEPTTDNAWDPQLATMGFKGILDGQKIEGTANMMLHSVSEVEWARWFFINLWIDESTYASFIWYLAAIPEPDAVINMYVC